ncbi:MAG: ATP-dependent helicase [Candidatus Pacebacteria bacterium]|nr:ATP-dependent helicase [Candidatus Paceibacterota bacterium]
MTKEITSPEFEKQYKALNESQKLAVDTIEGPVMVIAGPGTGKTTILSLRIAQILLKTDTAPENILALTFTESGVYAMRKKLVSLLGNVGYRVRLHTFHSFCNEVIQDYPEYFPKIIGGKNLANTDQYQIIEKILDENKWKYLTPYGDAYFYARKIISIIKDLKREGLSPDAYKEFLQKEKDIFIADADSYNKKGELMVKIKNKIEKIDKSLELADFYEKYQQSLFEAHKYDFDDMILEVVTALEKEEGLLLTLQEEYQYLLADEHQDTNNAQNKILELLASFHESPNIFIVGDEKQAIFRFQGASLNNFLYFKDRYSDTKLINLDTNYRSTQAILDASHSMILNNKVEDQSLRQRLISGTKKEDKNISLYEFENADSEIKFLLESIKEEIKNGTEPDEIAVLYRNNADLFDILKYLEKSDIPFTVRSDRNLLQNSEVRKLITMIRVADNPLDNQSLSNMLLFAHFEINIIDTHKILNWAYRKGVSIIDVLSDENLLEELDVKDIEKLENIYKMISDWSRMSYQEYVGNVLESIFKDSGMLKHILQSENSFERLSAVDVLFNEIKKIDNSDSPVLTKDFLKHINILEHYGVLVPFIEKSGVKGVQLMTAHKSKGLEFKKVFITGVTNKRWGGKPKKQYFVLPEILNDEGEAGDADERRLFYVAITRAKDHVSILFSKANSDNSSLMPSIFIDEIDKNLIEKVDTLEIEKALDKTPHYILDAKPTNSSLHDKTYLQEKFLTQSFSVTALNNYLTCPWKYFFTNLIRIPFVYSKHQQYGTSVHAAMKDFFEKYSKGDEPTKDFLLERFVYYLRQQKIDLKTHTELEEKGTKSLAGYVDFYKNSWPQQLLTEFNVSGIDFTFDDQKITLTGNLDKIEFNDNGTVTVVDYKTSKPKSRNALMGETQAEDGGYYRQLIFYKLLLDAYDDTKYEMNVGVIDFIEPDENSGKYKKEAFDITSENVEQLKETLTESLRSIYNFDFWDKKCKSAECEFCALRNIMND